MGMRKKPTCRKKRNREAVRRWRERNPEAARQARLAEAGLVTVDQYNEMFDKQGGRCAICGKTPEENGKRLAVDHCHATGRVRGLLCHNCNVALGLFRDDPAVILRAAEYVLPPSAE